MQELPAANPSFPLATFLSSCPSKDIAVCKVTAEVAQFVHKQHIAVSCEPGYGLGKDEGG